MVFRSNWVAALAVAIFTVVFFASCEEDTITLGEGVIGQGPFKGDKAEYDVFAYSSSVNAVQTNRLPLYQLGVFDDPLYGRTQAVITSQLTFSPNRGGAGSNPTFGVYTQSIEDTADQDDNNNTIPENETVKEVILYIPYQVVPETLDNDRDDDGVPDELDSDPDNPESDSDGDGVTDVEESTRGLNPFNQDSDGDGETDDVDLDTQLNSFARTVALDSIYSKRYIGASAARYVGEEFTLKVERSSFFLRELDPNTNFEDRQEYFSNTNIPSFTQGAPLFEGAVLIDNREIVTRAEDDPETDEDESATVQERLSPGIRVALDPDFFQENILDKEGSLELLSQGNFNNFIRGLHFSITPRNEDLMLLVDLSQANITITYEYDDFVVDDSDGGSSGIQQVEGEFVLGLLQSQNNGIVAGNAVNTMVNETLPAAIANQLDDPNENASRLYMRGGAGAYTELRLFDKEPLIANEVIEEIRSNNWLINEANLVFYVDQNALNAVGGTLEPTRLHLLRGDNGAPLYNPDNAPVPGLLDFEYDGNLETNSAGKGVKYTLRITDYINNIIVRDSANVPLRLALSANLGIVNIREAEASNGERVDLPLMNTITPLGTVLFGNNVATEEQDKRLKLQIFYTQPD